MNNFDQKAKTWDSDPSKTARASAVAEGIKAKVHLTPHMTAFEYGCGTGLLSFALQPYFANITSADSSSGMLAVLEENIASNGIRNMIPMKLDLVTDPLPQRKYHLICTLMTMHHILDIDKILRDFYTLLEKPGYLCVADLDKADVPYHKPGFTKHEGFDRRELSEKARGVGFHIIDFTTIFHMVKEEGKNRKDFPLFLMIAGKS